VTGASQGIGRDTALALAEAGAKVAVAARNEDKLATLVGEIVAAGGEAYAVKMDVADAEQVKTGFKQVIERFGRLDILVNNAAITRDGLAPAHEAGRLGCGDTNELNRRASLHPAGHAHDDAGTGGAHHQYFLRGCADGERRAGELRGREGWDNRADKSDCH